MSRRAVVSIIATNYLPQAKVLFKSIVATNPGLDMYLLVLDPQAGSSALRIDDVVIVSPDFMEIDAVFSKMRLIYGVVELATAVKPFILKKILSLGHSSVIYLDPDILVCGSLDHLFQKASASGIVLTPHSFTPYPRDGRSPGELDIMRAGIYNLGFIGVGAGSESFLDWWGTRLENRCLIDLNQGLFTDQKWIDWVPALFAPAVDKNPGVNVAYWNLHDRKIALSEPLAPDTDAGKFAVQLGRNVLVNGTQLVFLHFSGYSPSQPDSISKYHIHNSRVELKDHPDLRSIFKGYGALLRRSQGSGGRNQKTTEQWIVSGKDLGPSIRPFLREAFDKLGEGDLPFPDPRADKQVFVKWFLAHQKPSEIKVFLKLFRSITAHGLRITLRKSSIAISNRLRKKFGLNLNSLRVSPAQPSTLRSPGKSSAQTSTTLVRYEENNFSIGVVGQRIQSVLENLHVERTIVNISRGGRGSSTVSSLPGQKTSVPINLLAVNADQTPEVLSSMSGHLNPEGRTVGYWFWEINALPKSIFNPASDAVDEVWVATKFVANAFSKRLDVPVFVVPLPLFDERRHGPHCGNIWNRSEEPFVVLAMGDLDSIPARKNLLGSLLAYIRAFPIERDTRLDLKVSGSQSSARGAAAMSSLRKMIGDRADIRIIDAPLDQASLDTLFLQSHVFLSLHRAEGLGMNISDAVSFGVPVVYTDFGGCTDFLAPENSFPVRYRRKHIGRGNAPYPPLAWWAEPDYAGATRYLKYCYSNYPIAREKAAQARRLILKNYSLTAVSEVWAERLRH
jgi:glycosyltransferase involved in cell wall biosynthesis